MSPATASERLSALEDYYGATLLLRTTRSISPTEAGRLLIEGAEPLLSRAEDLTESIRHGVETLSGWIRISAPEDFGATHLIPLVDEFLDIYPDITIEVRLNDDYLDLAGTGLDLSIRLGDLKDSSLIAKKLGENHRIVCAAPEYLKEYGTPTHPDALMDHNCLIMRQGSIIDQAWRFNIDGKSRVIAVSGNRMANSGLEVRRWCLAGYGIALKSIWDIRDDLDAGRLVALLSDYAPSSESALQLVYPGGNTPTRRVRVFKDYLINALSQKRVT